MTGDDQAIHVREAGPGSFECEAALRLADLNRATLGFFPAEAFREQADAGRLLVATDPDGAVVGYLLYRTARERAVVVHLCVALAARGKGVAKALFTTLRVRVAQLRHIEARCRKDFTAHSIWSELGFVADGEVHGRGRDRLPITVFRYDHGHPDLFSLAPQEPDVLRCALDTSVLIGMQDERPDCLPLLADWIGDEIELVVTAEIRNDLNGTLDPQLRSRRLQYAGTFPEVRPLPDAFEKALQVARDILPPSSGADARHIARASSSEVDIFITADDGVLERAVPILDELGLRVLHPLELVRELDSLQSAAEYAPVQLAGTSLQLCALTAADLPRVSEALRSGGEGERDREFKRMIREQFQNPRDSDVCWVADKPGDAPLGLLVGRKASSERYEILALRVPPGRTSNSAMMRALARHLAFVAVERARSRGCAICLVRDSYLHPVMVSALSTEGFRRIGAALGRVQLTGVSSPVEVAEVLDRLRASHPDVVAACTNDQQGWRGELLLWPLKLRGSGIPNYIVPIQPRWAEHLFDPGLASQGLYGADRNLGLAREAVYYRSSKGLCLQAPARILWYVSDSDQYRGTKAIRACSTLDRVRIDSARNLYRRYRRLGVWKWTDVLEKAGKDPNGQLMALEFSRSECFERPISYDDARQLVGVSSTFQGPVQIAEDDFMWVYKRAQGLS